MKIKTSQSGNVLFIILFAVIMLGALTMMLSRSGGSSNQTGDVERFRVQANTMMSYASQIENAVGQLITSGISENDISFENSDSSADYTNSNCTNNYCLVFSTEGGGMSFNSPSNYISANAEWVFTGANTVGTSGNPVGSGSPDLVMLLANVKEGICTQINKLLDVDNGSIPTDTDGADTTIFTGSYSAGETIDGDSSELAGEPTGCFYDDNVDANRFYHVLHAR